MSTLRWPFSLCRAMTPRMLSPWVIVNFVWMLLLLAGTALYGLAWYRETLSRDRVQEGAERLSGRPLSMEDMTRMVLVVLAGIMLSFPLVRLTSNWFPGEDGSAGGAIFWQALLVHGGILWVFVRMLRRDVIEETDRFGFRSMPWWRGVGGGVLAYLTAFPLLIFSSLIYAWVLEKLGVEAQQQPVMTELLALQSPFWKGFAIVFAVLLAPVAEEAVFRGVLLPLAIRRIGTWPAVLLISMLFAGLHGHAYTALPLMLVAVCFSLGYLWRGNLLIPITMHACFNAVNFLTMMFYPG